MIGRCAHHGRHLLLVPSFPSHFRSLRKHILFSNLSHNRSSKAAAHLATATTAPTPRSTERERRTARSSSSPPPPPTTTVKLHNLLRHGCLPYPQTWAFQQVLLHRRLQQRRQRQQQQAPSSSIDNDDDDDYDCVILLEHSPVYTLGRGADENHLTFVQEQNQTDEKSSSSLSSSLHSASEISRKLSRKVRGPGSARLSLDKSMEGKIKDLNKRIRTDGDGDGDGERSMLALVEQLTDSVCPVIAPNEVPVYRVDRGGEVTFHGPSQLVVYPMLDLKRESSSCGCGDGDGGVDGSSPSYYYQADLHWYLRKIEDVILSTLRHYGIDGNRDSIHTGVWVGDNKIAAVGISSSRWITTHGFALNIDPDLSCFDTSIILPCGIEGRGVTSMAELLRDKEQKVPTVAEVGFVATRAMERVFGVAIQ